MKGTADISFSIKCADLILKYATVAKALSEWITVSVSVLELCVRLRLKGTPDTAHYYSVLERSTVQCQRLVFSSFPANMRAKVIVLPQVSRRINEGAI
jgi:hypothetical protein